MITVTVTVMITVTLSVMLIVCLHLRIVPHRCRLGWVLAALQARLEAKLRRLHAVVFRVLSPPELARSLAG
eukprot:6536532-Heterocapsa_arctica.AAC.1